MQSLVIAGTGVPGPVAKRFYSSMAGKLPNATILSLPGFGFGGLDHCYEHVEAEFLKLLVGKDPVIVVGHSQGALLAARLAYAHPGRVSSAFCLSGPFNGARSAELNKFVPAASDMSQGSPFLVALRQAHERYLSRGLGGRLHSLWVAPSHSFLPGDGVLWPTRSSYLPGARNHLVVPARHHARLRAKIPGDIELIDGSADHFSELSEPCVLQTIISHSLQPTLAA